MDLPLEYTAITDGFRLQPNMDVEEKVKILSEKEQDLKKSDKEYGH
jgi:hypothetical protein